MPYPGQSRAPDRGHHCRRPELRHPHVEHHLPAILRPKSTPGELNRALLYLPELFPIRIGAAAVESEPRRRGTRRRRLRTPPALPGRRPSPLPRALGPPSLPGAQSTRSRRHRAPQPPEHHAPPPPWPCAAASRRRPWPCASPRAACRPAPPGRPGPRLGPAAAAGRPPPTRSAAAAAWPRAGRPRGQSRGGGRAGLPGKWGPAISPPFPLLCFKFYSLFWLKH